jgi:hypothetical protein
VHPQVPNIGLCSMIPAVALLRDSNCRTEGEEDADVIIEFDSINVRMSAIGKGLVKLRREE